MTVVWQLPALLAADAGGRRTLRQELPGAGATLGQALRQLGRDYPKLFERICDDRGRVREHVNVFIRGEAVRRGQGLETKLRPGEEIVVLHAVSGGAGQAAREVVPLASRQTGPGSASGAEAPP